MDGARLLEVQGYDLGAGAVPIVSLGNGQEIFEVLGSKVIAPKPISYILYPISYMLYLYPIPIPISGFMIMAI